MASPTKKSTPRWFGYLFAGFACIFLVVGGRQAWDQGRLLTSAVAVPAVIQSARVESHRGSKGGTTYKPVVDFTYRIDGVEHTGHDPLPLMVSSSSATAEQVIARCRSTGSPSTEVDPQPVERPLDYEGSELGSPTIAWVDPQDHDRAFLLREVSFFPYLFLLFPMIHMMAGLGNALLPKQPPANLARRLRGLTMLWYGVGLLAAGHFTVVHGEWTILPQAAILIYAALGGILVFAWRKYARVAEATELDQH